jgi:hypothetical protein
VTAREQKPTRYPNLSKGRVATSGVAAALEALAFGGPIDEALHVVAVLPGQVEKLAGGQIGRFFAEEGLKTPTDIGTLPRTETITASRIPVILHCLEHFLAQWANRPALFAKTLIFGRRRRKMVVHEHPAGAALLPNPGIAEIHFSSLTVL